MSLRRSKITEDIERLALKLESSQPEEIIEWAVDTFHESVILACSFGAEDLVLLDMLVKKNPMARAFYLDTDKHFQETYDTKDILEEKYKISFIQMKSELTLKEQSQKYGSNLWESNPDLCCALRKVLPLQKILTQHNAWMTGIRRDQSPTRASTKKVEWDQKFQLIKLNPLATWTNEDVWKYIHEHQIPYNPLHDQNYPSIGCSVCTKPIRSGEDPRSGRWSGLPKTECGLHQ